MTLLFAGASDGMRYSFNGDCWCVGWMAGYFSIIGYTEDGISGDDGVQA